MEFEAPPKAVEKLCFSTKQQDSSGSPEPHSQCQAGSEFPLGTGIQPFADFGHETGHKIRKSFSPVAKRTKDFFDRSRTY